jgi:hypothetical protein
LIIIVEAVWPSQDDNKRELARTTTSPFVTQLAKFPTVLAAISYHIKMNDYWWTLAKILVANWFHQGKYHLPGGMIVYEQEPHFFGEEEQEAINLTERSIETSNKASQAAKLASKAQKELKQMEESVASLQAQVEAKEAEMEKLKQDELVAHTQGEQLKGKALRLVRKTSGESSPHG